MSASGEGRSDLVDISAEQLLLRGVDGPENLGKELREMRDNERARKAKLQLENEDGLELHTKLVKSAVEYTASGGGSIEAKAKGRKTYNSKRKIRRIAIPDADDDSSSAIAEFFQTAKRIIFER